MKSPSMKTLKEKEAQFYVDEKLSYTPMQYIYEREEKENV